MATLACASDGWGVGGNRVLRLAGLVGVLLLMGLAPVVGAVAPSNVTVLTAPFPDNLTLYLPFDSSSYGDASGYFTTTLVSESQATGLVGNALVLDGEHTFIRVSGNPVAKNPNAFTAEFWLKSNLTQGDGWLYYSPQLRVGARSTAGYLDVCVQNVGLGCITFHSSTGDDVWHHHAVVFDALNSSLTLYVDGRFDVGFTTHGAVSNDTGPVEIGGHNADYLSGRLDEFRVWNRALSFDNLRHLHYGYYDPLPASIVIWLPLNTTFFVTPTVQHVYNASLADSLTLANCSLNTNLTGTRASTTLHANPVDGANNTFNVRYNLTRRFTTLAWDVSCTTLEGASSQSQNFTMHFDLDEFQQYHPTPTPTAAANATATPTPAPTLAPSATPAPTATPTVLASVTLSGANASEDAANQTEASRAQNASTEAGQSSHILAGVLILIGVLLAMWARSVQIGKPPQDDKPWNAGGPGP